MIVQTGYSGFQFQGLSGGDHNITVESSSTDELATNITFGTITVRGSDAILFTNINGKLNILACVL